MLWFALLRDPGRSSTIGRFTPALPSMPSPLAVARNTHSHRLRQDGAQGRQPRRCVARGRRHDSGIWYECPGGRMVQTGEAVVTPAPARTPTQCTQVHDPERLRRIRAARSQPR
jgi:hypothetical protein